MNTRSAGGDRSIEAGPLGLRRPLPWLHGALAGLMICAALGLACGDAEPTGPGESELPDIVGTYTGTWDNRAAVSSTGQEVRVSCPGGVIIKEQDADGGFSGFWTQVGNDGGCPGAAGTLAGSVAGGGALTISEFVNTTGGSLEESTSGQCVIVVGSNTFEGRTDGRTLEISRSAHADCGGTEITYSWELTATSTD